MGRKEPSSIYLPDCRVSKSVPASCIHAQCGKDDVNRITRDHWSRLVSPLQENFSLIDDDSDDTSACKKDASPECKDTSSPSSGSSSPTQSPGHEGGPEQDTGKDSCKCPTHCKHAGSHEGTQHGVCPNGQHQCRCREASNNAALKAKERRACMSRCLTKKHDGVPAWEGGSLTCDDGSWNSLPKCPKIDNLILVEPETVAHFDPVKKAQVRREVSDCLKEEMLRAKACVERETNRCRSYFNYKGKEILLDPRSQGTVEKVDHRNENYLNRLDDILKKKCIVEEDEPPVIQTCKHVKTERHGCAVNRRHTPSSKQRKKLPGRSRHSSMNFHRSDKLSVFERLYRDAKHIKYANRDKEIGAGHREMKDKRRVCCRDDVRGAPSCPSRLGASPPRSHHRLAHCAEGPRVSCSFNTVRHDEDGHDGKHGGFTEKQLEFLENLPEDFTVQESKSLIKAIVSIIQRRFSSNSKQTDNSSEPKHHCGAGDYRKENFPEMGSASEKQSAPKIIYSTRASDVARSVFRGDHLKASASDQFSKNKYTESKKNLADEVETSHKTNVDMTSSGKVPSDTCLSTKDSRVDRYNLREEIDNILRPRRSKLDITPLRGYGSSFAPSRVLLDSSPTFKYRDLLKSGVPIPKTRTIDGFRSFPFDNDDTTVKSFKFPFKTSFSKRVPPSFELDPSLTSHNESFNKSPPFSTIFSSNSSRLRTRSETLIKSNPYLDIDPKSSFFNPVPHDDLLMDYTTTPKSSAFIKERTFLGNFSGAAKSSFLRMMEDNRPQKCWLDKVKDEHKKFVDISKGLDRCTYPKTATHGVDEILGINAFHIPDYGVSPKPCPHMPSSMVNHYDDEIYPKRETRSLLHDLPSDNFKAMRQTRQRPALQGVKFSDTLREACLDNIASLKSFNSSLVTKSRFLISNTLDRDSGEFENDSSKFDLESFKRARRKRDRFNGSTMDIPWGPKLGGHGDLDDLDALSCSVDTIDTANTSMTARLTELNQRYDSSMDDWKTRYSKEFGSPHKTEDSAEKIISNFGEKFHEEFNTKVEPSPVVIEIKEHKTPSAPAVEIFESASTQTSENLQDERSPRHHEPKPTDNKNVDTATAMKTSSSQVNPAKERSPNNSSPTTDSTCTTPSLFHGHAVGSKPIPGAGDTLKGTVAAGRCPDVPAHSLLNVDKPDLGKALAILENFSPIKPVDIHTKYPLLLSRRHASQPNDSGTSDDNSTGTWVSRSSSSLYKPANKDRDRQSTNIYHQASTQPTDRSKPNDIGNNCQGQDIGPQRSSTKSNDWLNLGALHGSSAHQTGDPLDEMLVHLGSRREVHHETLQQEDPVKNSAPSQKQSGPYGASELSVSTDSGSCNRSNDKMPPSAETIISRIMKSRWDQFGLSFSHAPTEDTSANGVESHPKSKDVCRANPNHVSIRIMDSDTSSNRQPSLAGHHEQQDDSMNGEVMCDVTQQDSVRRRDESMQDYEELNTSSKSDDGFRTANSGDALNESDAAHDEVVRRDPKPLVETNTGGLYKKEPLSDPKSSCVKINSDQLDSAVSRHIENRALKSTSSKTMMENESRRTKSANNATSAPKPNVRKNINCNKPDVHKPLMCSDVNAVRSCRAKPRDTHVKSGSYNTNCLADLKIQKDIVVIDLISETPGTPEPVTVKEYTVSSGVPVKVKSYQTRTSSPRFVVRTLDSKAPVCCKSAHRQESGSQNTRHGRAPALKSVQFNCSQDKRKAGVKFASQPYTICANNNSKACFHAGSDDFRSDFICPTRDCIEASGSESSVTCSDHVTDDNHDTSSKDEETSEVSDGSEDQNNCNIFYLGNDNSTPGDSNISISRMRTIDLYRLINDSNKSRPSLKLLGELAFQLERRILDYVFGMEDSKRRRFYGYTVSNIFSMMERETKFPKGGSDIITKSELAGRLKKLLQALEKYGYNIKTHGEFAQEMVNKYGLLACPPDESTIAQFGLNDPNAIAHLIQQLAQGPSEISSLMVLLNSLKYLSKCDQRPLFIW